MSFYNKKWQIIFSLCEKHCVGFSWCRQEAALLAPLEFCICYNYNIYRKRIFWDLLFTWHTKQWQTWFLLVLISSRRSVLIACWSCVYPMLLTKRYVWAFKTLRSIKFSSLSVSSSLGKKKVNNCKKNV